MRLAVVSDVHGNLTALEAVVGDVRRRGIDRVVHGGRVFGVVEKDEQLLHFFRLQELLRAGDRHLHGAIVVFFDADGEHAGDAHVHRVE